MPILLILIVLVVCLGVYLKTPNGKGWLGELKVKFVIGKTKPGVRYVINNLLLNLGENKTSQIDHVLINKNGVFVIETKNYSGRVYGNEDSHEWTQVLNYGRIKNKLYNPIKQNKTHIYHLSNRLSERLPMISAVVFVRGNTQFINANGVYRLRQLKKLISEKNGNNLSISQMERAYYELVEANDTSIKRSEHIKNIRSMQTNIDNNICPRCGKKLVLRKGKNGGFYGCSGYPNCKFTKSI